MTLFKFAPSHVLSLVYHFQISIYFYRGYKYLSRWPTLPAALQSLWWKGIAMWSKSMECGRMAPSVFLCPKHSLRLDTGGRNKIKLTDYHLGRIYFVHLEEGALLISSISWLLQTYRAQGETQINTYMQQHKYIGVKSALKSSCHLLHYSCDRWGGKNPQGEFFPVWFSPFLANFPISAPTEKQGCGDVEGN